mmetsp:Transcript_16053/g.60713  ORF Transcript_16053/g.60713 Transcript_16053/m.60713 type:complete len:255 (-) Transcript_16053:138-902(-)
MCSHTPGAAGGRRRSWGRQQQRGRARPTARQRCRCCRTPPMSAQRAGLSLPPAHAHSGVESEGAAQAARPGRGRAARSRWRGVVSSRHHGVDGGVPRGSPRLCDRKAQGARLAGALGRAAHAARRRVGRQGARAHGRPALRSPRSAPRDRRRQRQAVWRDGRGCQAGNDAQQPVAHAVALVHAEPPGHIADREPVVGMDDDAVVILRDLDAEPAGSQRVAEQHIAVRGRQTLPVCNRLHCVRGEGDPGVQAPRA